MPERTSDEKAVCLSVKRVICDKTEEISVQIFIPYERPFSLRRRMVGRGDPFYLKFWVEQLKQTRWSEIADFHSIFARSASQR